MERTFGLVYPSIPISVKRGRRGRKSYLSSNGRYHSILGEERDVILGEERDVILWGGEGCHLRGGENLQI